MIIPIRCYSCGKPISAVWDEYKKLIDAGEPPKKVLDDLGLTRYCCRRMILTHTNIIEEVMKFGPQRQD